MSHVISRITGLKFTKFLHVVGQFVGSLATAAIDVLIFQSVSERQCAK